MVEAAKILGPEKVQIGDVVLGMASSGLHSNGYSLVRKIVADSKLDYTKPVPEFGTRSLGEVLLEPTMLYTGVLNQLLESELSESVHALSHITGGGIAANLSRVLPAGVSLEVDRSTWSPADVFRVLADWGAYTLESLEGTWNLGLGFAAVVSKEKALEISSKLNSMGVKTWQLGIIEKASDVSGFITSAKGVDGGAVRLTGSYA